LLDLTKAPPSKWFEAAAPLRANIHCNPIQGIRFTSKLGCSETGCLHLCPNLMFHFLPIAVRYDGQKAPVAHGYQVHVGPMYLIEYNTWFFKWIF
jgi:hypothetical protein